MFDTYEDYLQEPAAMTLEEMRRIHGDMLQEVIPDEDAWELYQEVLEKALSYSQIRAQWVTWDKERKRDEDEGRTLRHNSVIIKFNQLARYLRMQGKPAHWRDELGYEEDDRINRKRIGDFACYLIFVNGLNGR